MKVPDRVTNKKTELTRSTNFQNNREKKWNNKLHYKKGGKR